MLPVDKMTDSNCTSGANITNNKDSSNFNDIEEKVLINQNDEDSRWFTTDPSLMIAKTPVKRGDLLKSNDMDSSGKTFEARHHEDSRLVRSWNLSKNLSILLKT